MKQYAVIGIGRFGLSVAKTLYSMGHDVLAVDKDHDRIQEIYHYVTHAVEADSTDEDALKALGLRNFDAVVITIGSISSQASSPHCSARRWVLSSLWVKHTMNCMQKCCTKLGLIK